MQIEMQKDKEAARARALSRHGSLYDLHVIINLGSI